MLGLIKYHFQDQRKTLQETLVTEVNQHEFQFAVLAAEVIQHFIPKLVQLHNYSPANGRSQKICNWSALSRKVLSRLGIILTNEDIRDLVIGKPMKIESVLLLLKHKITKFMYMKPTLHAPASGRKTSASQPKNFDEKEMDFGDDFTLNEQLGDLGIEQKQTKRNQNEKIAKLENKIKLLELKVHKMNQLLQIKDAKLHAYEEQLKKRQSQENDFMF